MHYRETSVGGASENRMDLDGSELKSGKNRKMGKKKKRSDPMKDSDFGETLDDQGKMNLDETELESEKTSSSSSSKETTKKMRKNKKQKGKSSKLVTLYTAAKSSESLGNDGSENLGGNKYDRKRRKDDNLEAEKYGHSRKKKVKQASKIVSQHATEDDVDGSPSMTHGNCEENNDMQERNNGAADFEKPKKKKKCAKNKAEKKEPNSRKGGTDDLKTSGSRKKKKVSFAGDAKVVPPGNKTRQRKCKEDEEENLVQGKQFTHEEDELVKKAVLKYIEEKQRGEEGVDMVMNCKKHPQVKNCWKDIDIIGNMGRIGQPWQSFLGSIGSCERYLEKDKATPFKKRYKHLTSPLVNEGLWVDSYDYRLLDALQNVDACCVEDVDWDNLLEHRSGDICRKRWDQMTRYIGGHKEKSFIEQVDVLSQRYCPEMLEYRK